MKTDKDDIQTCGYTIIHEDVVNDVRKRCWQMNHYITG